MSAPTSAIGAAGAIKLVAWLALGLGFLACTAVVMILTLPKTQREWTAALLCTLGSSLGGGAAIVSSLGLMHWGTHYFGIVALFGVAFACGLPGWVCVRWWFRRIDAEPDRSPVDFVKELDPRSK